MHSINLVKLKSVEASQKIVRKDSQEIDLHIFQTILLFHRLLFDLLKIIGDLSAAAITYSRSMRRFLWKDFLALHHTDKYLIFIEDIDDMTSEAYILQI